MCDVDATLVVIVAINLIDGGSSLLFVCIVRCRNTVTSQSGRSYLLSGGDQRSE